MQGPRGTEACDWGRGRASHGAGGALRGAAAAGAAAPPQALAAAAAATPLSLLPRCPHFFLPLPPAADCDCLRERWRRSRSPALSTAFRAAPAQADGHDLLPSWWFRGEIFMVCGRAASSRRKHAPCGAVWPWA